jgi:hypothetical protein
MNAHPSCHDTDLRNLDNIEQKAQKTTLVMEVDSPGNKSPMVGRCPCICCKMEESRVFLGQH